MMGISDSSRRIHDIVGAIDGIAFQTNILVLNAPVESARAGERGLALAVMASEVRALAHRSAQAAEQIKELIPTSVAQVESGSLIVDQAGRTMQEVVVSISRARTSSARSACRAPSISHVGQAVTQMDQVTQKNAALV